MQVDYRGDIALVTMHSRVDVNTAKEVESELMKLLGAGTRKLVCDFSDCEYISSAGLRVLLQILKQLQSSNGAMALSSMQPFVHEVLDMAGFLPLFHVFGSADEASKGLAPF
jgi:anti-anti-sigma factor